MANVTGREQGKDCSVRDTSVGRYRVLLVSQPTVTGAAQHVLQLAKHLDRTAFEVAVACPDTGWLAQAVESIGVRHLRLDLSREISPVGDIRAAAGLLGIIRREKPHVLHLHASKAGFLGRILQPVHRVPVVIYTPHGLAYRQFPGWRRHLYLVLERLAEAFGECIVCVSESERQSAVSDKLGRRTKIVVIENGVDLPSLMPQGAGRLHALLGLHTETQIIAMLARLESPKRPQDLVKAAEFIQSDRPYRIVFMGDGRLRAPSLALAQDRQVDGHVLFMGYRQDAADLMEDVAIVVLASDVEGMPFGLLEGMAARKPVVGTDVPGIADLIQDGVEGFLYTPGSVRTLADYLNRLLENDGLRIRLGVNGRKRVESSNQAEWMVNETSQLYRDLLNRVG